MKKIKNHKTNKYSRIFKNNFIYLFCILFCCIGTSLTFGAALTVHAPEVVYGSKTSVAQPSDVIVHAAGIKKQIDGSYKIVLLLRNNKKTGIRFKEDGFSCWLKDDSGNKYPLLLSKEQSNYSERCFNGKESKDCQIVLVGTLDKSLAADIKYRSYGVSLSYKYDQDRGKNYDIQEAEFDMPDLDTPLRYLSPVSEEYTLNIKNVSLSGEEVIIKSVDLNPKYISLIDQPVDISIPLDKSYEMKFKMGADAPVGISWVEQITINYMINNIHKTAVIPIEFYADQTPTLVTVGVIVLGAGLGYFGWKHTVDGSGDRRGYHGPGTGRGDHDVGRVQRIFRDVGTMFSGSDSDNLAMVGGGNGESSLRPEELISSQVGSITPTTLAVERQLFTTPENQEERPPFHPPRTVRRPEQVAQQGLRGEIFSPRPIYEPSVPQGKWGGRLRKKGKI